MAHAAAAAGRAPGDITLIAVSKTFGPDEIIPVIRAGHRDFGENRVQEANSKWPTLKAQFPDLRLHLIGPLQSNKAADAVRLFDAIHTLDRPKIAAAISAEIARTGRSPMLFIQVNTGAEPQKAGVAPEDAEQFLAICREQHGLPIAGLMCIPPVDEDASAHFRLLARIGHMLKLPHLSMGMSGDFETAIRCGATYVRVGSAIFGTRTAAQPASAR
jgi:hypothetical protein